MTPITDLLHKVEQDLTNIETAKTVRDGSQSKVDDVKAKLVVVEDELKSNEDNLTGARQVAAADMRELAEALVDQADVLDPPTPIATPEA